MTTSPRPTSLIDSLLVRLAGARVVILFLFHAVVFASAYVLAYLLRFDFNIPPDYAPMFKAALPVVVVTQLIIGIFFSFYRGWWRYVGIADVMRLVFGVSTASAVLVAGWYASDFVEIPERFVRTPRGVLVIDWAFALLTLFGARVLVRLGRDRLRQTQNDAEPKRVVIIGAGDAGETLAREMEHRPQLGMKVVSFVDDQRAKWGSMIRGIKVVGPISNIAQIADELAADEALIAIPSASGKRLREIISHLAAAELPFKTIPGIDHLVSGKVHVSQIRPVNVEDLLRRKRIELPGDPVRELFAGKRVLVTGAGGSIGSELASQILAFAPTELHLLERSEYALYTVDQRLRNELPESMKIVFRHLADIRDRANVDGILRHTRPEIVLHAAAHKHVPLGEENPPEYIHNNTIATRDLAELCGKHGVDRFVFVSTDKAINPTSVMGASKRAAEITLLAYAPSTNMKLTIVRFGNVIGSSGSVIPLFLEQIKNGGPVTVTHPDVTRYFIRTSEAISLVLQAATLGDGGHVFMLDMGEPVKIVDLARDLIHLANRTDDEIPIVFTGLRPGEKLFEEVRLHSESMRPTVHPQIVITEAPQPRPDVVSAWLRRLEQVTTREQTINTLRELIAEYVLTEQTPEPGPRATELVGSLMSARMLRPHGDAV